MKTYKVKSVITKEHYNYLVNQNIELAQLKQRQSSRRFLLAAVVFHAAIFAPIFLIK